MSGICGKQWLIYLQLVLFLSAISCKTRHVDSEPTFTITCIKKDIFKIKKFCFKNIYGTGQHNFENSCIDTVQNDFQLPVNLDKKSCIYIFEQTRSNDTLEVQYEIEIGNGAYEFEAIIKNFRIAKTTFDSVSLEPGNRAMHEAENITIYL